MYNLRTTRSYKKIYIRKVLILIDLLSFTIHYEATEKIIV
jgi:hypothetical protein